MTNFYYDRLLTEDLRNTFREVDRNKKLLYEEDFNLITYLFATHSILFCVSYIYMSASIPTHLKE